MELKADLSFFDLMNIVVGAIVGSDIYIVPGLVAGLLGPFAIIVWVVAGAFALVLAMVFAYCSYYVPNVGGSFAYVSKAFDNFFGFIAGWSMVVAEVVALPVFAIVFTNYLGYFITLDYVTRIAVRAVFVVALVAVNIFGVRAAGRLNDVLTIAKLTPLLMIIALGIGSLLLNPSELGNYSPFVPAGVGNFGTAMVLIFWAYAGFELGTLPSAEVVDPKKNVPRAMIGGMAIVIFFYVLTNISVFGVVNWTQLSSSAVPLVLVSVALLGGAGSLVTGVGALASVSGTDETEVLGTARLIYAMSKSGLLPKSLGSVHRKYKTPYVAVVLEGLIALALMPFTGISQLISFAVFNLAVCYLLVCLSLVVLRKPGERGLRGQGVLPWLGVGISLYLLVSTPVSNSLQGLALVLLGLPVYFYYSKKTDLRAIAGEFASEEIVLASNLRRKSRFLGYLVKILGRAVGRGRPKSE